MKYIDTEKLKTVIRQRIKELDNDKYLSTDSKTSRIAELHYIDIVVIDSLQQEQPEVDLEEDEIHLNNAILAAEKEWGAESCTVKFLKSLHSKRIAGRGVSMIIADETEWADVDLFVHRNCEGGAVIQIRKKEE